MSSEIFRFAIIRQPQYMAKEDSQLTSLELLEEFNSDFVNNLRRAKASSSRAEMVRFASEFAKSTEFLNTPKKISLEYADLALVVRNHSSEPADKYFADNYRRIFDVDARTAVGSPEFRNIAERSIHSLIAAVILRGISPTVKSFLVLLAYELYLMKQLAEESIGSQKLSETSILLPDGIFPLPTVDQSLYEHRKKEKEIRKKAALERNKTIEDASNQLQSNNAAIKEILDTFEKSDVINEKGKRGFFLTRGSMKTISNATKNVLAKHGLNRNEIDVAKSVTLLEKSSAIVARELYGPMSRGKTMVKVGSSLLPQDYIAPINESISPGKHPYRTPGLCPPAVIDDTLPDNSEVTVPDGHGEAEIVGFADLMIVEQKLSRYELGEIAHVENVLKKELRERELRTTRTKEESTLVEIEETEEQKKDLATTDRFELQDETQKVISDTTSLEAGLTVNSSWGPTEVTATGNYATTSASQESHRTAANYARDTTMQAASRLEKRRLERRFVRTVEEIVEINKRTFDNKEGNENISGIYRWVNKIYEAQVINYGKRFMLEFIVPEPAAFLRYAGAQLPSEEVPVVKPDPPGYCLRDGKTFQPLSVEDITRDEYLYWVAQYGVEDVSPPPSNIIIVSVAIANPGTDMKEITSGDEDDSTKWYLNASHHDINIPDGYIPYRANINLKGEQTNLQADLTIQIQDAEVANHTVGGWGTVPLANKDTKTIPVTVGSRDFLAYEVIVNVFCIISVEKFQEWQLATFRAILNAYNDKKARYENAVEAMKVRAGFTQIRGKNPFLNRETEKIELKKGCISLLTGQRFEDFDAVNANVAPHLYPEIDFLEARAEGKYIRFFEQAFEWTNMTYLFYPYFWSNKKEWIVLSKLDDEDPLFTRFLQAGSARALVPVRPGFEKAILNYLRVEDIWNVEGATITHEGDDPTHFSILDELKEQLGNNSVDGKGTLTVEKGKPNILGIGTEFTKKDENRRIIIKGKTYVIKKFHSPTSITLSDTYQDDSDTEVSYALGGILVGQPWEIKLPTNLITLDTKSSEIV